MTMDGLIYIYVRHFLGVADFLTVGSDMTALISDCSLVHASDYLKLKAPVTSSPMTGTKDSRVDQIKSHQCLDYHPITTPCTINVQPSAWDL